MKIPAQSYPVTKKCPWCSRKPYSKGYINKLSNSREYWIRCETADCPMFDKSMRERDWNKRDEDYIGND